METSILRLALVISVNALTHPTHRAMSITTLALPFQRVNEEGVVTASAGESRGDTWLAFLCGRDI